MPTKTDVLKPFDLFRFPIQLYLKYHTSTYTILGKFFTILVFSYICYSLAQSNSFKKKYPKVSNQDLKTQGRLHMSINKSDIGLIFGITDEENIFYADYTIFSFKFTQVYANFSSGEHLEREIELKLCESSDFLKKSDFYQLGLNK